MQGDGSMSKPRVSRMILVAWLTTVSAAVIATDAQAQDPPPRPRVETTAAVASTLILPGFGGLVSVRTGRAAAIEAGVDLIPWLIIEEDGNEAALLFLAQVRLPWREGVDRRRSFTLGFSNVAVVDREWETASSGESARPGRRRVRYHPRLMPHAGIAWHWRTDRTLQLRLDVQAIASPVPLPRVALGVTWGAFRSASAALPRTSDR